MEISKERLAQLLRSEHELKALESYRIDNWCWYDDAISDDGEGTFPLVTDVHKWDDDKIIEELYYDEGN